jgi:hypothetical protein
MSENETAAAYVPQWVNKLEVAVRQVRVAILLHFETCDPVALHTLVAAVQGVIADLAQGTDSPSTIGVSLRVAADFFRQAANDRDGRLNIEPLTRITEDLLFDAVKTLQGISEEIPFEAKVYWAWFMGTRSKLFENCGPAVDAILRDGLNLSTMSFREIRQFLRFHQLQDNSEPLPEWALLGPALPSGSDSRKQFTGERPVAPELTADRSAGDGVESEGPSQEYLERVRALDGLVRECGAVSRDCAGIRAPSASHFWASVLFTTLCTRAVSLLSLVPYSPWSKKLVEQWDYASVASLTRSLLEIRVAFFYLCTEECSQDEWYCRWNIFNIHDCTSRIHMFSEMDPSYDVGGFQTQLDELRGRLLGNAFFQGLSERQRKQILNGKTAYLSPLEDIAARSGVELRHFRWLYKFLSSHVHGYPMSYYRMDDGERGRGIHSDTEEGYTQLCLSFSLTLLTRSRDEMKKKFAGLTDRKEQNAPNAPSDSNPVTYTNTADNSQREAS